MKQLLIIILQLAVFCSVNAQNYFEAKKLVRELLENGKIEIYPKYKDHYGRFVCEVYPSRSLESLKQILESKNLTTGKYTEMKVKKPRIIYYQK